MVGDRDSYSALLIIIKKSENNFLYDKIILYLNSIDFYMVRVEGNIQKCLQDHLLKINDAFDLYRKSYINLLDLLNSIIVDYNFLGVPKIEEIFLNL